MVGILGKNALASVSLANAVFFIMIIFGFGISSAISTLIASVDIKNEYKKGFSIFYHGLVLNFSLSIFMYAVVHIFFYLFPYLGQPKEILNDTISFLEITSVSFIPWMMFEIFRKFSEGLSLVFPSLVATWSSAIINIILNYIFLNGKFGFPKLGILGVAYATLISRIIMLACIFILLFKYKRVHKYYNYFKFSFLILKKKFFKKILKIGIPSGLHMLFEMSAFAVSSFISGQCGIKVLAAHQIVINLVSSTFLLSTGLSVAATVRIGNQLALKNYSELRKVGKSILFMGSFFMLICNLIFFFFRKNIPYMYINDKEVAIIAEKMIIIAGFFQLSDGIQGIILGALRGLQDVHIPMWISLFSYWVVAIPIAWLLSIKIGGNGIWMGLGIGLTISAILLFIRYETITKRLLKKNNNNKYLFFR